jgi:heat shock protein HtpX
MAKRVFLFLVVNFLVMITLTVVMRLLGVEPFLRQYGLDYQSLAVFCLVWGMGGAFISLLLSKTIAKIGMRVQIIDPQSSDPAARELLQTVSVLAQKADIPMPEVGIYESPELNAFATGPTKKHSLIAVSTGLLQKMNREERDGVLGHELSHIANGDMVTMTLLQGVINAFVLFLSRVLAYVIASAMRDSDRGGDRGISYGLYFIVSLVLQIVFMIFGSMVVAAYSRWREYRADAGGAHLAGRPSMVGALQALQRFYQIEDPRQQPAFQNLKISAHPKGWLRLFASHPPLEVRIARLQRTA